MTAQFSRDDPRAVLLSELCALPAGDRRRPALRAQLITEYLPLARYLARRMAHRRESIADLEQVASIGLMRALDRFDASRGVEFSAYAVPTIVGEIKRYFRDTSWCVHVPRGAQELQAAVRSAEADLQQQLGRPPTTAEVGERVGVSVADVLQAREVAAAHEAGSLDAGPNGETPGFRAARVEDGFEQVENRAVLRPALSALDGREREILVMRFVHQNTQAEIARAIGISQMQVSRLIARSLRDLRQVLAGTDVVTVAPGAPGSPAA